MKALFNLAAVVLAGLAVPAMAQSNDSYTRGYNSGYNDNPPIAAAPNPNSDYGRGFQDGQDDADDDDAENKRKAEQFERDMTPSPETPSSGGTDE